MRAGLYVRVSTDEQVKEGYSLDGQKQKLIQYCADHNYDITELYEDAGVSGKSIIGRPGCTKMLQDAKLKKFDCVCVLNVDRLSRNLKNSLEIVEILNEYNIKLFFLEDNIDTKDDMGYAMYSVRGTFAELERKAIKKRMISGKRAKVEKGLKSKNGTMLFGYYYDNNTNRYVENKEQANIVRLVFNKILKGDSINSIALFLTTAKIKNNSKYNCWYRESVTRMLRNPTYKGYTFISTEKKLKRNNYTDNIIIKKANNVDIIIPEELFDKVNGILDSRIGYYKKVYKYANKDAWFADVCYCAVCNWKLSLHTAIYKTKTTRYYVCSHGDTYKYETRHKAYIRQEKIEKSLFNYINNIEVDFNDIEYKKNIINEFEIKLTSLDSKLKLLKKRKLNLQNKWLDQIITDEDYITMSSIITAEINEINNTIKNEKNKKNITKKEIVNNEMPNLNKTKKIINEYWSNFSDSEKRNFITSIIEQLFIDMHGNITVITFK